MYYMLNRVILLMKKSIKLFTLLVFIAITQVVTAADVINVPLKNRSASSLKSTLSELVGTDVRIIADGNNLILYGEKPTLNQLKKIIKTLDVATPSLLLSIYRGVDPNLLKDNRGVKRWGTTRNNNRLETVVVESGQRLVIAEKKLLVVPIESFSSRFNSNFSSDTGATTGANQTVPVGVDLSDRQGDAVFNRSEIVTLENSLFVEASLLPGKTSNQQKDTVYIRYSIPSSLDNPDNGINGRIGRGIDGNTNNTQEERVLSLQTHVMSQQRIAIDEWLQLSGKKVTSFRPALKANKKVYSTQKRAGNDDSIWIKVSRE